MDRYCATCGQEHESSACPTVTNVLRCLRMHSDITQYDRIYLENSLITALREVVVLREANTALTARLAAAEGECVWTRPEGWEGMHDTECGHLMDYEESFKRCPYCGKKLVVK